MIKVEVTEEFKLAEFYKVKPTLERAAKEKDGWLFKGDTFECDPEMLAYLQGGNKYQKTFVKVIEVVPEENVVESVEFKEEAEPELKVTKKGRKKKNK